MLYPGTSRLLEEIVGDIGRTIRRLDIEEIPDPAQAPVQEPSPEPVTAPEPEPELQPA